LFDAVGTSHQSTLTWLKVDTIASTGQLSAAQSPTSVVRSVTDADGNVHDLNLTYTRNATNDWSLTASTADGTVQGGPIALAFDAEGNLTTPADAEISVDWTGDTTDSVLRLDLSGLTQVATGAATVAAELNPAGASWKLSVATDDAADTLTGGASTYVTFNKDGTLAGPSTHTFGIDWADSTTMAADSSITLNFASPNGSGGMGSFGESYSVGSVNQDGIAFGAFSGVSVGNDGLVVALFDNGQSRPVYRIPLARFASPENLAIRDGNAYQMTNASGGMFLSASGENGAGAVTGGTLESSTVDLAGEFTSMITTQRAYSANATIIRTADEMLQELSQLKR
jgi:flagellar hook protein FlgE